MPGSLPGFTMQILSTFKVQGDGPYIEAAHCSEATLGELWLAISDGTTRQDLKLSPEGAYALWEYLSSVFEEDDDGEK